MIKILLKKQMMEIFRSYFYDAKKNKKRSKSSIIAFIVLYVMLMVGVLGGFFAYLSSSLCVSFLKVDMGWMYFTMMGMMAIFLGTFGSIFNTYSSLYLSKDNDLLFSLPIPKDSIIISRLLSVYLMGGMYTIVVILPALIVYWLSVPFRFSIFIGGIIYMFLLSVIVLILSSLLGRVVAGVSLKLKNKSFITVIISLLFLFVYYFFYFKAQKIIEALIENAAVYGKTVKGSAYPLYLFGCAGEGKGIPLLIMTLITGVLFVITLKLLRSGFMKIATSTGKTEKVKYREKFVRKKGVETAILGKEFGRFTGSPNYMLNCGMGTLLLPIGGVFLLIKGQQIVSMLNRAFGEKSGCTLLFLCAGICMIAAMNDMAEPSVSLEGKNIWIAQSLPVTPWQILQAKLRVQLILTGIPAVFCIICMAAVVSCYLLQLMLASLLVILFVILSAEFAVFMGLKMPNLTWTNEIAPIKQSMGVMISMFGGWLYSAILAGAYMIIGIKAGSIIYLTIAVLVTGGLSVALFIWLKKRGTIIFKEL